MGSGTRCSQRRLRTTSTRTSFDEITLKTTGVFHSKMCSLIDPAEETTGVFHHETTKSEIQQGEECKEGRLRLILSIRVI